MKEEIQKWLSDNMIEDKLIVDSKLWKNEKEFFIEQYTLSDIIEMFIEENYDKIKHIQC